MPSSTSSTPWPDVSLDLHPPDEVARAALFYASDLASCVTGTMLNVDCGEFHDE